MFGPDTLVVLFPFSISQVQRAYFMPAVTPPLAVELPLARKRLTSRASAEQIQCMATNSDKAERERSERAREWKNFRRVFVYS